MHDLTSRGIACCPRNQASQCQHNLLLADTFGELPTWMAHSEMVIIGGSFKPKGGQNPLEAIRYGKLVITGPDMSNFVDEQQALSQLGALVCLDQIEQIIPTLEHWLAQPETRHQLGKQAKDWLANQEKSILDTYRKITL